MKERIKEIPVRFVEFWNKYSSKQKTIIISVICAVLVLIGVVSYLVSRPTWVRFQEFSTLEDASQMCDALQEQNIAYKSSRDGLTLYVHENAMTDALYAMSDNDLTDTGYTWDEAFDNSMSTTEKEKSQKRVLALQSALRSSMVNGYSFVRDAQVFIDVPENTYSVLDEEAKTSVTALVVLEDDSEDVLTSDVAQSLASWLANAVGTDTENVVINDSEGNCLYNGSVGNGLGGTITGGAVEYAEKLRNTIASNVIDMMVKSGYDDVEVGTQGIRFNMEEVDELRKEYTSPEGAEEGSGIAKNRYTYSSTGTSGGPEGEPGTASNDSDNTDYTWNNGTSSNSSVEIEKLTDIFVNETIQNIRRETPAIEYDDSSLGLVLLQYQVYDEDRLKADGTLDNMTFDEFIAQNNTRTPLEVTQEQLDLIAVATGINADNIRVMAYQVPKFVESTRGGRTFSDYLMIILAVLIIALLIFVVIRGTAPVRVSEMEPELSVEQLLATTKENQSLEDIEFSDKSETRKLIEKFVDENPEAVAQLLRHWISDDWD